MRSQWVLAFAGCILAAGANATLNDPWVCTVREMSGFCRIYYDTASYEHAGGMARIWGLMNAESIPGSKSTRFYWEFDCTKPAMRFLHMSHYSDEDGKGDVLHTSRQATKSTRIEEHSHSWKMRELLCKKAPEATDDADYLKTHLAGFLSP